MTSHLRYSYSSSSSSPPPPHASSSLYYASSPPCSTSPTTSPTASTYSRPYIASASPYPIGRWSRDWEQSASIANKYPVKLPSFRSMFGDLAPYSSDTESCPPPATEKDCSPAKSAPAASLESVFYTDSEEDVDEVLDDHWLPRLGSKSTHFAISDERGRWPEPLPSAFRQRYSEPTGNRPRPIALPTHRVASEPAHKSKPAVIPDSRAFAYDADHESDPMASDGGALSSPDIRAQASLPPSSPPLSPKSSPTSPDLTAHLPFSSPLSDILPSSPSIPVLSLSPLPPTTDPLSSDNVDVDTVQLTPDCPPLSVSPPDPFSDNAKNHEHAFSPLPSSSHLPTPEAPPKRAQEPITCDAHSHIIPGRESTLSTPSAGSIGISAGDQAAPKGTCLDDVLSIHENGAKRRPSEEPAPRKKRRVGLSKAKPQGGDNDNNIRCTHKTLRVVSVQKPPPRRRRRAASFSSSGSSDSDGEGSAPPPESIPKLVMNAEDAEIFGMIVETMATSRASSLSATYLCKNVLSTRPGSKRDWNAEMFARVLEDAHKQNGVFGKVESSGKDHSDRPLEAQWFYVPERDEDEDRANLVRSMMRRPAKRSETKKYKQYYYKPLGKITRWDDEDAL